MEQLERLGWAAGFTFTSYGVRIGVRTNRPEVLERLVELLPPGYKPAASAAVERIYSLTVGGAGARPNLRGFTLLYGDSDRLARTMELDDALDRFESDLQLYIAERARRRVFIHGGVVGWRGQAIMMPGRSFSGKTTLVAELVRAGATYYSDEYAVLDAHGRVHPFPKPLGMRYDASARQTKLSVESLGGHKGSEPLPVAMVLISEYKAGARWRPRRVSAGQGALALLDNAVAARHRPESVLTALRQVVARASVVKSKRGEASELATLLLRQVAS
jgi:hypothetical protein